MQNNESIVPETQDLKEVSFGVTSDKEASDALSNIVYRDLLIDQVREESERRISQLEGQKAAFLTPLEKYLRQLNATDPAVKTKQYATGSIRLKQANDSVALVPDTDLTKHEGSPYVRVIVRRELNKAAVKAALKAMEPLPTFVEIVPGRVTFSYKANDEGGE